MTSVIIIAVSIGGAILILLTIGLLIIGIIKAAKTGGSNVRKAIVRTSTVQQTE